MGREKRGGCLVALLLLALTPFSTVAYGWLLSLAWRWFVMPLGVGGIGIAQACGLTIVARMLVPRVKGPKDEEEKTPWHIFAEAVALEAAIFGLLFALAATYHSAMSW